MTKVVTVGDDFQLPPSVLLRPENLLPGTTITVNHTAARPTSRTDVIIIWVGGTTRPAGALGADIHLPDQT